MAVKSDNRRVVQRDKAEEIVNLFQSVVPLKYGGEVHITRVSDSIAVQINTNFLIESSATSLLLDPITYADSVGIKAEGDQVALTLVYYPI